MLWLKSILSAILVSLGLGGTPEQTKLDDKCEQPTAVSVDQLGGMLEQLGYGLENQLNFDGEVAGFQTELNSMDYTVPLNFRISGDRQSVTITAALANLGAGQSLPMDELLAILQLNNRLDNPYVYGINEHNLLTVQVTIPLAGLTVESLDEVLWNLEGELMTTEDLWYSFPPAPIGTISADSNE